MNRSTLGTDTSAKDGLFIHLFIFVYSEDDPDHSQDLMGSKSDHDPSSDFLKIIQPVVFVYSC